MIFQEIYSDIVNSFDSLWKSKVRGNTLEIITPFATLNHKFVSVFITFRNDEYIVSDGGWIESSVYEVSLLPDEDAFQKFLYHYIETFNILEIKGNGTSHFYKKTSNSLMIPSLVFDLANFISSIVSACNIEFSEAKEIEERKRFNKIANNYLSSFVTKDCIDFQGYLDKKDRTIKVNAIYICPNKSKIILLNYITGTNSISFNNSIFKSNTLFGMSAESKYAPHIKNRIALINDSAEGYLPNKSNHFLKFMLHETKSIGINWSEKEKLISILN